MSIGTMQAPSLLIWKLVDARSHRYYDLSHNSICGHRKPCSLRGARLVLVRTESGQHQGTMCQDQNVVPLGDIGSDNIIGTSWCHRTRHRRLPISSHGSQRHER